MSGATADVDVVIVGAGLAGLACARRLARAGKACVVLEASDGVGGRVRTDEVDGYLLDRGFQILLTAYPEVQRVLDLDALALGPFEPGARIWVDGRPWRVADPRRRPDAILDTLRAPIGSPLDKLRVLRLVASVRHGTVPQLLQRPDTTTMAHLRDAGFSEPAIDRLWRPLFAGIQLDPDLEVSARRFDVILRMLAVGGTGVPSGGMGAIPAQLAAALPESTVRTSTPVARLDGTAAVLPDGTTVRGRALVVATDGPAAAELLDLPAPRSRAAACVWFATDDPPPEADRLLSLAADDGPATNVAWLSAAAPTYAPPGHALVACAVPGTVGAASLADDVRAQLRRWHGARVDGWTHLRTDRIPHAHPDQPPPLHPTQRVQLGDGRYVCGDHRDTASIQGALFSGRRTAEAVLDDLARA